MHKQLIIIAVLLLSTGGRASADGVMYQVTVNTSSIIGTSGSLDFQFNPGPLVTQSASLEILGFASDGSLAGTPALTGDVSGTLPSTLTFDNGTLFNDYFGGVTFGKTLSFEVVLSGPALTAPDGTSTSGSAFAFSMFSDSAGTVPVLTGSPDGVAFRVDVNLDGTTTLSNFSNQVTVTSPTPTPEPGSLPLLATGLLGLSVLATFRRKIARSE